jgi:hypothetical protein
MICYIGGVILTLTKLTFVNREAIEEKKPSSTLLAASVFHAPVAFISNKLRVAEYKF